MGEDYTPRHQNQQSALVVKCPSVAVSRVFRAAKTAKNGVFQRKTEENRKKPVETGVLPLTNAFESRRVKGGRFFRSRVNTGL
jgi:hypothetical protein